MNKKTSLPSVIFYGTPEFARYCLVYLFEASFTVLAVVTAPDRKAGRGKKITTSAVKDYALLKGIPVLQPVNLKAPEFIDQLQKLNAEVYAVVAFRMLPKVVWSLPLLGTINLHASLLPNYRGAAPINWVLINGENETGVTGKVKQTLKPNPEDQKTTEKSLKKYVAALSLQVANVNKLS